MNRSFRFRAPRQCSANRISEHQPGRCRRPSSVNSVQFYFIIPTCPMPSSSVHTVHVVVYDRSAGLCSLLEISSTSISRTLRTRGHQTSTLRSTSTSFAKNARMLNITPHKLNDTYFWTITKQTTFNQEQEHAPHARNEAYATTVHHTNEHTLLYYMNPASYSTRILHPHSLAYVRTHYLRRL